MPLVGSSNRPREARFNDKAESVDREIAPLEIFMNRRGCHLGFAAGLWIALGSRHADFEGDAFG